MKMAKGKNGFEAAIFQVDPEFGFSGEQRRIKPSSLTTFL